MKAIFFLISIYMCLSCDLAAQSIQNFLGIYTLTEVCSSHTFPGYSDTLDHEIEIIESSVDTFDIQFCLALLQDTIRALVLSDSSFHISLQRFPNYDSTTISVWGEGFLQNDSIEIHYGSGGSAGLFECYCKGIRKKGNGLKDNKVLSSIHHLYPNPVKETLNINLKSFENLKQGCSISIYGIKGNLVLRKNTFHSVILPIDVSELSPGTYMLSISNGKTIQYSGIFIKE